MLPENFPLPPANKTGFPWTEGTEISYEEISTLPEVTIITPSFQQGPFLEETIRSVLLQNYPNLEYIIMDGGSTDESINIIKKYEDWITVWKSEKDKGQSDAINKGLRYAKGKIFNWVNSDDVLAPRAIWKVIGSFDENPCVDIICGTYTAFSEHKKTPDLRMKIFPTLEKTLIWGYVSPCCMFWKMETVRELGEFNPNLQHAFDLEIWWRYLEKNWPPKIKFIPENLTFFRLHPNSKTIGNHNVSWIERYNLQLSILKNIAPNNPWCLNLNHFPIEKSYQRKWDLKNIDNNLFINYSKADMLKCFPLNFSFFSFYKTYLNCLFTRSFPDISTAIRIPLRRIYKRCFQFFFLS